MGLSPKCPRQASDLLGATSLHPTRSLSHSPALHSAQLGAKRHKDKHQLLQGSKGGLDSRQPGPQSPPGKADSRVKKFTFCPTRMTLGRKQNKTHKTWGRLSHNCVITRTHQRARDNPALPGMDSLSPGHSTPQEHTSTINPAGFRPCCHVSNLTNSHRDAHTVRAVNLTLFMRNWADPSELHAPRSWFPLLGP